MTHKNTSHFASIFRILTPSLSHAQYLSPLNYVCNNKVYQNIN